MAPYSATVLLLCVTFRITPSAEHLNTRSAFGLAAEKFFFKKNPKDLFGNTEKFPRIFSGLLRCSCKNKVEKTF